MGIPETKTDSSEVVATSAEIDYKALYELEQKRAKDNQAAYTKSRQELSVIKKEAQMLEEKLQGAIILPDNQLEELEALKFDDPDAWYKKKQEYEKNVLSQLQETKANLRAEALQQVEKQTQDEYVASWLTNNPEITLDMIDLDVPPRIHKAYKEGTLSIDEFLEKSKEYLTGGNKKLASPNVNDIKDLNKVPGGKSPDAKAIAAQAKANAKLEIY